MRRSDAAILWFGLGILVAALLSQMGCAHAPKFQPREGQEIAVHIAWVEVYGRADRPPLVRWMEGDALNCTDTASGRPGFYTPGIGCKGGRTLSPFAVAVAWVGDETSFADSALNHELRHVALLRDMVIGDHHSRPDFFPLVDIANHAVRAAGR